MFGLPKFGDGIGLSRILRFYHAHDIDEMALSARSIVVTGSNGKGSSSRFLAAALSVGGRRVGLFTSPHLFDVRERFVVGEERISKAAFDRYAQMVLGFNASLREGDKMGAFEFLFLIAILWYREEKPDVIVWEAGIGGRYDPVRTLRASLGVLTGLELEHTQILGASEEQIAYDKIDALAPGGTLVISPCVAPAHRERIESYCTLSARAPVFVADVFAATHICNRADGACFDLASTDTPGSDLPVHLRLIGPHQVDNALTAYLTACLWLDTPPEPNPDNALLLAIARTTWPGRLEKVTSNPDLWIDVGHTPRALDLVTNAFLEFSNRKQTLVVFGVSASKEVIKIAKTVADRFDHFILTRAHKAGAEPKSFASAFAGKDAVIQADLATAAQVARERAVCEGLSVLALGGMFLAIEVQHAWAGGDPADLDFF